MKQGLQLLLLSTALNVKREEGIYSNERKKQTTQEESVWPEGGETVTVK